MRKSVTVAVLGGWVVLYLIARRWGTYLIDTLGRDQLRLSSPPLVGWDDVRVGTRTLIPIVVAGVIIACWHPVAARLTWRRLLVAATLAAAVWAVALGVTTGWSGITDPLVLPGDEYLLEVPGIDDPVVFLDDFTETIDGRVTHVRSHPPGFVLFLWGMTRIGLGGTTWVALLVIGVGSSAVAAVLVAVRAVTDEDLARRAAPFIAIAPAAVWVATTADAFFAGVGAWGVALLVLATHRDGRRPWLLPAVGGGLLLGAAMMLSYGLALLWVIPAAMVLKTRRWRPVLVAGLVAGLVILAFVPFGFWYLDGIEATRREYAESVASTRPYNYFVVANLAALALALGPATFVGLARLRSSGLWWLVGGALAIVAFADISGLSKGEVERIWLPFAIWILPAGAALTDGTAAPSSVNRRRGWLSLQALIGLAIQSLVRTRW